MFAAAFLASWDTAERVEDVQLCVSELVANCLVHGGGSRDGFKLRLTLLDRRLSVAVTDSGTGRPVRRAAAWDAPSGRGLLIVNEIADRWGVEEHAVGKTVWAEFGCSIRGRRHAQH